jgi:hypothetical protein
MSQGDSGVKYLFAGLGLILGLVIVALFFQPFWIWIQYRTPKTVSIETLARSDQHEGGQVRVEGILDPRHVVVVDAPGGGGLLEVGLVLADDKPMRDWQDAIDRDVGLLRTHAQAMLESPPEARGVKEYLEQVDEYDSRWNTGAGQLATTIRDAWPNYAVGYARPCPDCTETGMHRQIHPERGWILEDYPPPGGIKERPAWPEDILLSNPITRTEIPMLKAYLDEEVAYYRGSARQVLAELDGLAPARSFGQVQTVIGTVHPMPLEAFESYEAIDDLLEDVYFYLMEGETPSLIGLYTVPVGVVVCLLMLALIAKWALGGRRGYADLADD